MSELKNNFDSGVTCGEPYENNCEFPKIPKEKIKLEIQYQFFIGNERYKIKGVHSMGVFATDDNGVEWMVFMVNKDIVGMLGDYQELRGKLFEIIPFKESVDRCMFVMANVDIKREGELIKHERVSKGI